MHSSKPGNEMLIYFKNDHPPKLFLHPTNAFCEGHNNNDEVGLENEHGKVAAKVTIQKSMKPGHVRGPHGWWYPELYGSENLA